ncbi:hypothetical protein DYBT9275_05048 [Dyadobacter sp. CECT 9275]|uniref:DUF1905 domain-containing protein n=2 Tax=Dyadobacter helix TaxID=2822344 RepID=A0A916JH59_9BACT|nr:hypothetical protein DYBT9275_05048 [Dyadobacter sp. CECT 9275]
MAVDFETRIHKLEHLAGFYLEIPSDIVQKLGGLNNRLICTANQSLSWQCGLAALGNGSAYITFASPKMKKLKVKEGDTVHVSLQHDHSDYGAKMPVELQEVLDQDDEGNRRFHKMAAGKQRYIMTYISDIKSGQLRIERAVRIIENIKRLTEGKEKFADFMKVK